MSKKSRKAKKATKPDINPIRDYIEAKKAYDEAKAAYEHAKAFLTDCFVLKNADTINCGEYTAHLSITTQNRFDSHAFRAVPEYNRLYEEYRRPVTCTHITAQ